MALVNIHCHMLYGVDDGPKNPEIMMQMIDKAYKSGVRTICMTPHNNPAFFHCPIETIVGRYKKTKEILAEKYPDLKLYLGEEVFFYHDTVEDLLTGKCLPLNKTRNVLVEFSPADGSTIIMSNVSRLITSGFNPVIAHIERYDSIRRKKYIVGELKRMGVRIQVNAASIIGKYGFLTKRYVMSLIKYKAVDVVADDCHNMTDKEPCMREAYDIVCRKFGESTARALFMENPQMILDGQ